MEVQAWDYVVVGGGIAGLMAAYMLAGRGGRVAVLTPAPGALTASGAAAGIVTTLMPPRLAEMALRSAELIGGIAPQSLEFMKAYWVPGSDCSSVEAFNVERGIFYRARPPEWINADNIYEGRLAVVDTGVLMTTLHSLLSSMGVALLEERAVVVDEGVVYTSKGVVRGAPVVAAGPWSRELLPELKPSTLIYRCQVASLRSPPPNARRTIVIDDELDFYVICWGSECLVGDGANDEIYRIEDGFKPELDDLIEVAYKASERLPWLSEARVTSYWAAPCIAALDAAPLVGMLRKGVWVITGFNGAGVTLAPASAEVLAGAVEGVSPPPFLDAGREIKPIDAWPPEPFRLC